MNRVLNEYHPGLSALFDLWKERVGVSRDFEGIPGELISQAFDGELPIELSDIPCREEIKN